MGRQAKVSIFLLLGIHSRCFRPASYQIYALKPKPADQDSKSIKSPSPLLQWWDAYPVAQSTSLPTISTEEVADLVLHSAQSEYAVIDVRRNDHGVSHPIFLLLSPLFSDLSGHDL
jgi:hypothetical protein